MATRKLEIEILGDEKDLNRALGRAGAGMDATGKKSSKLAGGMRLLGKAAKFGAVAGLAAVGATAAIGVKGLIADEKALNLVTSALESTGGAAKVSSKDIQNHAAELQKVSGTGADVIMTNQSMLLTFTSVRNEVGKGNDIFSRATETALDMSIALGSDMKESTIQVGKALNDPIKGVSALQRVGIQFTESQKDQIKTLVESGDTLGAQKLILGELETQFAGTAETYGQSTEGKIKRAKAAFEEVAKALTSALLPAIGAMADWLLNKGLPAMERFSVWVNAEVIPAVKEFASDVQTVLGPILQGLGKVIQGLTGFLAKNEAAMKALVAVVAVATGVWAAYKVVAIASAAATKAKTAAMKVASVATKAYAAAQWLLNVAMAANPLGLVIVALVALAAGLVVAYKKSETFRKIVDGAMKAVKKVIGAVVDFVKGDFLGAFSRALSFVRRNWPEMATILSGPFAPFVALGTDAFGIRSTIVDVFNSTKDWVRSNWPEIATILSGPFAPLIAMGTDAFGIRSAVTGTLEALLGRAKTLAGQIWTAISGALKKPLEFRAWLNTQIRDKITGFKEAAKTKAGELGGAIVGGVKGVTVNFTGWLKEKLGDVMTNWISAGKGARAIGDNVGSAIVGGVKTGVENGAKAPMNALIRAINNLTGASKGKTGISDFLPFVSIPAIPTFARGTIARDPTLGIFGEAGPEALIPLSRGKKGEAMPLLRTAAIAHGMDVVPQMFALGGVFGDIGGAIKSGGKAALGAIGKAPMDALDVILDGVDAVISRLPKPGVKGPRINGTHLGGAIGSQVWRNAIAWVKGIFPSLGDLFGQSGQIGGATAGVWPILVKAASIGNALAGGGYTVTSGKRNSQVAGTGRPSRHNTGDAVDIGAVGARGDRLAKVFQKMFGLGGYAGVNYGNGANMLWRTMVGGNHYDHIHLASANRSTFAGRLASFATGAGRLSGLSRGTGFVPQSGPMLLHKGEAVLSPSEAAQYRARGGIGGPMFAKLADEVYFTNPTDAELVLSSLSQRVARKVAVA